MLDDATGELGQATIEKMEYLDQVIRETLRMYPPAPLVTRRESSVDVNLKIPGKTVLVRWETSFYSHACDTVVYHVGRSVISGDLGI